MLFLICTTISCVENAHYEVPYAQELGTCIWGPCYNSMLCATGSMLYAQLERTLTLGFDSKSRNLTLYQRKVTSEELPYWPLKQPNEH